MEGTWKERPNRVNRFWQKHPVKRWDFRCIHPAQHSRQNANNALSTENWKIARNVLRDSVIWRELQLRVLHVKYTVRHCYVARVNCLASLPGATAWLYPSLYWRVSEIQAFVFLTQVPTNGVFLFLMCQSLWSFVSSCGPETYVYKQNSSSNGCALRN